MNKKFVSATFLRLHMSVVAIRAFTETTGKKWTVESAEITPAREHVYEEIEVRNNYF